MNCKNCDKGFVLVETPPEYVTREMAIDAGDRRLEGQALSNGKEDYEICDCCHGDFENCKYCTRHENDF